MTVAGTQRISTRATGVVGVAILCSRVLGLIREVVFAAMFGASRNMDAFLTAFRAPNMLRDLFAEGALSTAFVTTFSRRIATEGDRSAWDLASKVATLTLVFMSAISLLGVVFAPVLIDILAPGFPAEKAELTVVLTRIMFPFILLVSLAALVMGMLNARHVFGPPAMASAFFNLGSIIGGVTLCYWLDPQPDWRHPHFGERGLVGLSIATLIGGLLQLAVQLPSLRRVGFRFHPDFKWRDPGVRTILGMMGPAMIAASAVQVNVAVNSIFASGLGDGPIAWLNIAFRLMQLPLGIFGVAVATVTLPLVSRSAAVGNTSEFRSALAHSVRLVLLLTIPAAIGLIILAEPIIQLIYQHGRFTHEATIQTAAALRFYAIGLAGYSADKVLAPAFYALDKRRQPHFNRGEFFAQLVFYFSSASWPPRAGAFDEPGGHHEFLFPLLDDAPLHETIGDWRHAENHWQTASCRLGLGRYLLGGIELFLYALPARSGVAKCNGDVGHHLLRRGRIFFRRILVARHRGARSCRSAPTTYWYGRFT